MRRGCDLVGWALETWEWSHRASYLRGNIGVIDCGVSREMDVPQTSPRRDKPAYVTGAKT